MKALILAAGLGTRLRPLTDTMPKALVKVNGRPMLLNVIEKLIAAGYDDIVINVHHFADQIIEYVRANDSFGVKVRFSDESDLLRETGGGIRHAAPLLSGSDSPVLVHNVDIESNLDLKWFASQHRSGDIASLAVSNRATKRYLLFDDDMKLAGWTNVETGEVRSPFGKINPKDYTPLAFSGIHQISPEIFPLMASWPEKFSIIDFYLSVCNTHTVRATVPPEFKLNDLGKIQGQIRYGRLSSK